jgi:hypothetical protein
LFEPSTSRPVQFHDRLLSNSNRIFTTIAFAQIIDVQTNPCPLLTDSSRNGARRTVFDGTANPLTEDNRPMTSSIATATRRLAQAEIQSRLTHFVLKHATHAHEASAASSFWAELFGCYGTPLMDVATFEYRVPNTNIVIDVLWKRTLLIEHKSLGKDLDAALQQARHAVTVLPEAERPKHLIVCDFQRFRVVELASGTRHDFTLPELPERWELLRFIAGEDRPRA